MSAYRPRTTGVDFGQLDKLDGVTASKESYVDKLKNNLDAKDQEFNNFDPTDLGFEVRPCWSTVQLKIIDERVSSKKSAGGIIVIESDGKLPYVWAEVLAVGPKVGFDATHPDIRLETFNKGDIVLCLETHISFVYLDDKKHSDYFEHDRSYIATIPDNRIILKKVQ